MDRYRLIASIVVLFIYLLSMYPWQTIVVTVILCAGYLILRNIGIANTDRQSKILRRREALSQARIYLSPYSDIWKNLKISNKYCTLRLGSDGQTITARENVIYGNRSLRVIKSRVHQIDDLWDMLCMSFDHNTSFDGLVELFARFEVQIKTNGYHEQKNIGTGKNIVNTVKEDKEKLDVNNASEIELTALPGVSIVMAKKLIKKREEIGGFKSVNDVCLFLKLKPHMQTQLEKLICVKKMKGNIVINRYQERKLDL